MEERDPTDDELRQSVQDSGAIYWYDVNGLCRRLTFKQFSDEYYYGPHRGERHRINGPAFISSLVKQWYYHNKRIFCNNQEEFERAIKMKAFW